MTSVSAEQLMYQICALEMSNAASNSAVSRKSILDSVVYCFLIVCDKIIMNFMNDVECIVVMNSRAVSRKIASIRQIWYLRRQLSVSTKLLSGLRLI